MATDDGGHVFPVSAGGLAFSRDCRGLSLREYIAAKAMAGLICFDAEPAKTARWSVAYADALIGELNKEQTDANPERPLA